MPGCQISEFLRLSQQFSAGAPRKMQPSSAIERLHSGSMPQAGQLTIAAADGLWPPLSLIC
jgi:hypothetical protein